MQDAYMAPPSNALPDLLEHLARSVEPQLRHYLRSRRLPVSSWDDLVQETLTNLIAYLRRRQSPLPSPSEASALAMTILRRRIVDQFRHTTRQAVESLPPERLPAVADGYDVEAVAQYRELLRAVLSLLLDLSDEERKLLLWSELQAQQPSPPLTPAARKRVERLRTRLRERLQKQFGISVKDYFRS